MAETQKNCIFLPWKHGHVMFDVSSTRRNRSLHHGQFAERLQDQTPEHTARNGPNRAPKPTTGSIIPIFLKADYVNLTSTGIDAITPGEV